MLKIAEFTVEYQKTLLGTDNKAPRFSWILQSDKTNVMQTAYRLTVSTEETEVFDSGKDLSEQSHLVEYGGIKLLPKTLYNVNVFVWDNKGDYAESSLSFETGLFGGSNFKGDFIVCNEDLGETVPLFCKDFRLNKQVRRARLYATALGVYEVSLNGKRVGDMYDAPGWTSYKHRLQYQTYDITDMLQENNNVEVLVANGWYKGYIGYYKHRNFYGDKAAFLCNIVIDFEDGSSEIIKTDESWRCRKSQITFCEFYDGERVDFTACDKSVYGVNAFEYPKSNIIAQEGEPVRITQIVNAVSFFTTPAGETVVDFGQNLTGIAELSYKGNYGEKIVLEFAEVLDKDGNFYTENLRSAHNCDEFSLSGNEEVLCPKFAWRGFRYVRISGNLSPVQKENFRALVLHTDMKKTGGFSCSDERINKLQSNIVWGQRDNFFDIPSDCPQRDERLGWTGDAQVFCRTAAYNYNVLPFFKKWMQDVKAEQTIENGVPQIVPNVEADNAQGCAYWGDVATIVPWTLYTVYGDKRLLAEQYGSMKEWVEYIRRQSPNYLWQSGFQYGDWLALDKEEFSDRTGATDKYLIATAYYAYSTLLTQKTAEVLEKTSDAKNYAALYKNIVKAFNKEYVTRTGRIVGETQTACVLLLYFNLIQDEFRTKIANVLGQNIVEHGNRLTTGFAGTPYLLNTLAENGHFDTAVKLLMREEYPGWLYEVKMGATTVWERWNGIAPDGELFDPGMNSFNHYAYGSVGDFLYRKIAGIDCLEPGYKKIRIAPHLISGITWVEAEFESVYGKISVAYRYNNGKVKYIVEIPVGTTAEILLPDCEEITVGSGKYSYEVKCLQDLAVKPIAMDAELNLIFGDNECMALLEKVLTETVYRQLCKFGGNKTFADLVKAYPEAKEAVGKILIKINDKKGL